MSPNLDDVFRQLRDTFGARLGQPVVHGGVVAMPSALAMTAANLARLEAAWRFTDAGEQAVERSR